MISGVQSNVFVSELLTRSNDSFDFCFRIVFIFTHLSSRFEIDDMFCLLTKFQRNGSWVSLYESYVNYSSLMQKLVTGAFKDENFQTFLVENILP
jgi:hypothetical protein